MLKLVKFHRPPTIKVLGATSTMSWNGWLLFPPWHRNTHSLTSDHLAPPIRRGIHDEY